MHGQPQHGAPSTVKFNALSTTLEDGVCKRLSTGWYYGWLKRCKMVTVTEKPLETSRLEWATSANLKLYFDNVKGAFLAAALSCHASASSWCPGAAASARTRTSDAADDGGADS